MTAAALPDGTLAGYRLVRRLGSGSRADVFLGVGSTGSVALKVFHPGTSRESIGTELDALGRVTSPHLVRLVDLAEDADGRPILVLDRVGPASIASVLARREHIECGEAVTLMAPLAALVAELADAGVAHQRIDSSVVHLGSRGEPVLLSLGHCELFEARGTMAAIDSSSAAAVDRDALAVLALSILARVRSADANARVTRLREWIQSAPRQYEFPGELAERLFATAEPLPISVPSETEAVLAVPGRMGPLSAVPVVETGDGLESPLPRWIPRWLPALVLDSPVSALKARVLGIARGVRPRFWIFGGAVLVALLLAATLIPSGSTAPTQPRTPAGSAPTAASETPASPASSPVPDDPVLASRVLLAARQNCIRELSVLCLDGVDEASSAAYASDAALVQRVESGGELSRDGSQSTGQPVLIERLGDTALVGLSVNGSEATSILVIRTRAGWRIRDYLTGTQATSAP